MKVESQLAKESYKEPNPQEINEAREVFARSNEIFLKNIIVDPHSPNTESLEKIRKNLELRHPAYDFRFGADYIVHDFGIIFDGRNYARWENIQEGCAYAVYVRPKGQEISSRKPRESREKLIQFIKAGSRFPLILGEDDWRKKIVENAKVLFGNKWRNEVLQTT